MARPRKCRIIERPPEMQGFAPFGMHAKEIDSVHLSFEEYESFKLVNYQGLTQEEAAAKMFISRPTFTRIYNKALSVIACAFAEGRQLKIDGGTCQFSQDWYRCRNCFKLIAGIENHTPCRSCRQFSNEELQPLITKP